MNKLMKHKRSLRNHFLFGIIQTYLNQLNGFLKSSINIKRAVLNNFAFYCQCKNINNLTALDRDFIKTYFEYLVKDKKYTKNSLRKNVSQVRLLFEYLVKKGLICKNPLTLKKEHYIYDCFRNYDVLLKNSGRSVKVILGFHSVMNNLVIYLKEKDIKELKAIDEKTIDNYYIWLKEKGFSKGVIYAYKSRVKIFFNYLVKENIMIKNPCIKEKEYFFLLKDIEGYLNGLVKRGYRSGTVKSGKFALNNFVYYLKDKGINDLKMIDYHCIEKFNAWLRSKRKLKEVHIRGNRNAVKSFFKYLYKTGKIELNPYPEKEKPVYSYEFTNCMNEYLIQKELENTCYTSRMRIKRTLNLFYGFLTERKLNCHNEIKKEDLRDFVKYLIDLTNEKGGMVYQTVSINLMINNLKKYIRSLGKKGIIQNGLSGCLKYLKQSFRLKRNVLTRKELVLLFNIKVKSFYEFMLKSIFIIQYASGLRISELLSIEKKDIDFENYTLSIFESKTGKERIVHIGEAGTKYLKIFIDHARPKVCYDFDKSERIFLSSHEGKALARHTVNAGLKRFCKKAGITKYVTSHCFRHSYGTHLLENGLGIKEVSDLLGHKDLATTERYTQLSPERLRKTINYYHPLEKEGA